MASSQKVARWRVKLRFDRAVWREQFRRPDDSLQLAIVAIFGLHVLMFSART